MMYECFVTNANLVFLLITGDKTENVHSSFFDMLIVFNEKLQGVTGCTPTPA